MASTGVIGYGSKLKIEEPDGSGTFVDIAEVMDVPWPELENSDVEFTNLDSANRTREYKRGLIEPGTLEFSINYTKAEYERLKDLQASGAERSWRILLTDASKLELDGYVKSIGGDGPIDDRQTNNITIKVSGTVTFTPAP